ncbi:MAG: aminopeptidase [Acidobacteriota bacterium]
MTDSRYRKLAENLVHYSTALQAGDKVLIEALDLPEAFLCELIRTVHDAGAVPLVTIKSQAVVRALMLEASEEQMRLMGETEVYRMKRVDAYIGIRGNPNVAEWSDVPADKMNLYNTYCWKPAHLDIRIKDLRWVVLRWPSPSMAQLANRSTQSFEDFYFRVCNMDYARMSEAMKPLVERMEETDRVRLVSPGTDLTFSIQDIPAIPCDGRYNLPDGEVFTAPVRDSVEGTIQFNSPTIYQGVAHNDIRLTFKEGKVVDAASNDTAHLNQVLDTDEGARYIGEFAIGFNPHITTPMRDILFDEKIAGSIHFTPGNAYEEAWNGNKSQIHWDMVLRMDPQAGGGEVWFDDQLVRKDGLFVTDELEGLNPDRLVG